jgi:signal peptidase I
LPSFAFGSPQEEAARFVIKPAYVFWLGKWGNLPSDMAKVTELTSRVITSVAKQLPESCNPEEVKVDLCGMKHQQIKSISMEPSILDDELVLTLTSGYQPIQRGDVLAYKARSKEGKTVPTLARLLALPGETVEIRQGRIVINGQPLAQVKTDQSISTPLGPSDVVVETTPDGRSYTVGMPQDRRRLEFLNFGPLELGKDQFFLLGDNRTITADKIFLTGVNPEAFVEGKMITSAAVTVLVSKDDSRNGLSLR